MDCPGHASLIKTIIAGARIIDSMILVVDVTKGIQTQTAECLVIGEILCDHLLIVLNKIDLLPNEKAKNTIEKMTKRLAATLQSTKFANSKIIAIAAKTAGGDSHGIGELMAALQEMLYLPVRDQSGPAVFAVDHCFAIRGQGTVMTGTVLQGALAINESIEIPSLSTVKKIKSMQMFRKPVDRATQGDRLGVCVTQFDPKLLERGLVCSPGLVKVAFALLIKAEKISYYKLEIESKAKFHVSVGNETVMAKASFFGTTKDNDSSKAFDYSLEYKHQDKLYDMKDCSIDRNLKQFAVLELEKCVPVVPGSLLIGSKLDMDVHTTMCRLAFKATTLEIFTDKDYHSALSNVKVFKDKVKEGIVDRMQGNSEVIIRNLLKKDCNLQPFIGLKVQLSTGEIGSIDSHFGTTGKIRVCISAGLQNSTIERLKDKKKKCKTEAMQTLSLESSEPVKVTLKFKKYVYGSGKKMIQS